MFESNVRTLELNIFKFFANFIYLFIPLNKTKNCQSSKYKQIMNNLTGFTASIKRK